MRDFVENYEELIEKVEDPKLQELLEQPEPKPSRYQPDLSVKMAELVHLFKPTYIFHNDPAWSFRSLTYESYEDFFNAKKEMEENMKIVSGVSFGIVKLLDSAILDKVQFNNEVTDISFGTVKTFLRMFGIPSKLFFTVSDELQQEIVKWMESVKKAFCLYENRRFVKYDDRLIGMTSTNFLQIPLSRYINAYAVSLFNAGYDFMYGDLSVDKSIAVFKSKSPVIEDYYHVITLTVNEASSGSNIEVSLMKDGIEYTFDKSFKKNLSLAKQKNIEDTVNKVVDWCMTTIPHLKKLWQFRSFLDEIEVNDIDLIEYNEDRDTFSIPKALRAVIRAINGVPNLPEVFYQVPSFLSEFVLSKTPVSLLKLYNKVRAIEVSSGSKVINASFISTIYNRIDVYNKHHEEEFNPKNTENLQEIVYYEGK